MVYFSCSIIKVCWERMTEMPGCIIIAIVMTLIWWKLSPGRECWRGLDGEKNVDFD
jgi:hypothetical protein